MIVGTRRPVVYVRQSGIVYSVVEIGKDDISAARSERTCIGTVTFRVHIVLSDVFSAIYVVLRGYADEFDRGVDEVVSDDVAYLFIGGGHAVVRAAASVEMGESTVDNEHIASA